MLDLRTPSEKILTVSDCIICIGRNITVSRNHVLNCHTFGALLDDQQGLNGYAKLKMMERVVCGTNSCTEPSMCERLTEIPFLSKLKDGPGIPTVCRVLSQYTPVPHSVMNL